MPDPAQRVRCNQCFIVTELGITASINTPSHPHAFVLHHHTLQGVAPHCYVWLKSWPQECLALSVLLPHHGAHPAQKQAVGLSRQVWG